MCMFDDGEGWAVFHDETRTCAKPFRCGECGRDVGRGERYYYAAGKLCGYDGWESYKTCAHCRWIAAAWLSGECGGWLFGGVYEDLYEHRHEVESLDLALGRAIVGMRRKWRKSDGSLMPFPQAALPLPKSAVGGVAS